MFTRFKSTLIYHCNLQVPCSVIYFKASISRNFIKKPLPLLKRLQYIEGLGNYVGISSAPVPFGFFKLIHYIANSKFSLTLSVHVWCACFIWQLSIANYYHKQIIPFYHIYQKRGAGRLKQDLLRLLLSLHWKFTTFAQFYLINRKSYILHLSFHQSDNTFQSILPEKICQVSSSRSSSSSSNKDKASLITRCVSHAKYQDRAYFTISIAW